MNTNRLPNDTSFSISAVSEQTGVNPVTLRAWERRYGVIKPARTEGGCRLYTQKDVQQIQRLLAFLDDGISISRAAARLREPVANENRYPAPDFWQVYISQMMYAIGRFDDRLLDEAYSEAISLYPIDIVTDKLLIPLLELLGERWDSQPAGVAEEHFFSVYMRNKLGARFHHHNRHSAGATVITARMPGEHHEFGLLLFSLALMGFGHKVVLLGTDLPLEQLNHVTDRTRASAMILTESIGESIKRSTRVLKEIVNNNSIPVFIGGPVVETNRSQLIECGLTPVGNNLRRGAELVHSQL